MSGNPPNYFNFRVPMFNLNIPPPNFSNSHAHPMNVPLYRANLPSNNQFAPTNCFPRNEGPFTTPILPQNVLPTCFVPQANFFPSNQENPPAVSESEVSVQLSPLDFKKSLFDSFIQNKHTYKMEIPLSENSTFKKTKISIADFRHILRTAFISVEQLSKKNLQSDSINSQRIQLLKKQCQDVCDVVTDCLPLIQKKLKKIQKKRLYRARIRQDEKEKHSEKLQKRMLLHEQMDAYRNELLNKENKKEKEAELKKEADVILSEVRRKILEADRTQDRLRVLEKLRAARQANALSKGLPVSPELVKQFECSISSLRSTLQRQLEEYKAEERALLVMMEEERAESSRAVRALGLKKQEHIKACLFGEEEAPDANSPLSLFYRHHTAADTSIDSLLFVRRQWDSYLSDDGDPIPLEWVTPSPPSSTLWETVISSHL